MGQQSNWRFCMKCNAMFYAGYQGGSARRAERTLLREFFSIFLTASPPPATLKIIGGSARAYASQ